MNRRTTTSRARTVGRATRDLHPRLRHTKRGAGRASPLAAAVKHRGLVRVTTRCTLLPPNVLRHSVRGGAARARFIVLRAVWLRAGARAALARRLRCRGGGTQYNLAKLAHKVVRLPITSRALDIDELTRPVQIVGCPARHDVVTVDNCRQCRDFRRIEHSDPGQVVVCSGSRDAATQLKHTVSVQQKVQLPHVCASIDTTLSALLPYADTLQPWEAIPVLDPQARPVGVLMGSELHRLSAGRMNATQRAERIMSTSFATVFLCMSLADAAKLRSHSCFRGVIVVSEHNTFVGVVSELDLERGRGHGPRDTANPR